MPRAHEVKTDPDDEVLAQCWCGVEFVFVRLRDIRKCQTGSCGKPRCKPET